VLYGRSEEEWAELKTAGKGFLIERATMRRTTTYTELNAALVNRTNTTGFNFDLDADRAAIGHLLGQISQDTVTEANELLISALVQYLGANDAGPGFYTLARQTGFTVPAASADRQPFWAEHVSQLHEHFAPPRRARSRQ
jgi:hypothetical protein